ncbi:MarR family winged helix-turn-helix transcriptional regulator [Pseudomonas vancouverensis]|uniref:MarR family transcriptional regulator n=1 Tax=Pseudomonas vancouverensis TaxID=95300 RepID=A0A1H2NN35_PSEVA|nr:MarR family transcriptional regulator [Pseudomonas vancouverensis]KAB0495291.1 MarR family transcriptional regulator [Pseudomonas vancouverensis]TDB56948.1 MarR family transcriptional regulator [Pseudomonas vancouverensis]SDV06561.1 DNA-binding transcriptional regulator, MarR family [Pseudomonas vancouverensis]
MKLPPPPAPATEDPRNLQIASDTVAQQLQQIAILTRKAAGHLGTVLGINQTDVAALEHLITDGPLPPTELASRLGVTTAGITQVIDRLERAGHVVRERQLDDKRRVLVCPVPDSVARTYRHISPMLEGLGAVLGALGGQDRAVVEAFLGQVIEVYRSTLPGNTGPVSNPQDSR